MKRKFPKDSEDILLIKSMLDMNEPKFEESDTTLFNLIIQDLFPGLQIEKKLDEKFNSILKEVLSSQNLQATPPFL